MSVTQRTDTLGCAGGWPMVTWIDGVASTIDHWELYPSLSQSVVIVASTVRPVHLFRLWAPSRGLDPRRTTFQTEASSVFGRALPEDGIGDEEKGKAG